MPTCEQYAAKLAEAVEDHAQIFAIPCDVSAQMLLPFPPVCVLTLDDLIEGDAPQAPSLAMLVDGPGFTEENTVVVSARARRRHQVIGAKAIREHLGNADVLPTLTVATLIDALFRHNRLTWDAEASAVVSEIDTVTTGAEGFLEIPPDGRRAKDVWTEAGMRQNWAALIDEKPYSRPFASTEQFSQYIGWDRARAAQSVSHAPAFV